MGGMIPALLLAAAQPQPSPAETALELERLRLEIIELRRELHPELKWNPDRMGVDWVEPDVA